MALRLQGWGRVMTDKQKLRLFERVSALVFVGAWILLGLDGTRLWTLGIGYIAAMSWFIFGTVADLRE